MSRPGPLALLRVQRLRTAAVLTSLFLALALAVGSGSSSQQEPVAADDPSFALSAVADQEPASDRGVVDGHDVGVLCLAITCLLVVLAIVLASARRADSYLGLAARQVRTIFPGPTGLHSHLGPLETPTRC